MKYGDICAILFCKWLIYDYICVRLMAVALNTANILIYTDMYTLRIIEETRENEKAPFEQVVDNFELGDSYVVFGKGTKRYLNDVPRDMFDTVRMLLIGGNGRQFWIRLSGENTNYSSFVMTDSGKTFERL